MDAWKLKVQEHESKILYENFDFIKATNQCLIVGGAGQGKTVLAVDIINRLHEKDEKIIWFCPMKCFDLQKQGKIPQWIKLVHMKYYKFQPGFMHLFDDAAVSAHVREWYKKYNINLVKILGTARHKKAGVVVTAQESADIDAKILPKTHYVIFKKPNRFAAEMERPVMRDISMNVRQWFKEDIISQGLDSRKYAYVIATDDDWEGWVGPVDPPEWFSPEIGDW